MKLSQKKEDQLWSVINNCIFDARVEIAKLGDDKVLEKVDNILFKTGTECPEKAISLLKQNKILKSKIQVK